MFSLCRYCNAPHGNVLINGKPIQKAYREDNIPFVVTRNPIRLAFCGSLMGSSIVVAAHFSNDNVHKLDLEGEKKNISSQNFQEVVNCTGVCTLWLVMYWWSSCVPFGWLCTGGAAVYPLVGYVLVEQLCTLWLVMYLDMICGII